MNRWRVFQSLAILATVGAASCDSANETDGTGATGGAATGTGGEASGTGGTTPTGQSITLTLDPFDVQPGTERQVCKYFNLPTDEPFDVVKFRSEMKGTSHHLNVYKLLTDVDAPVSGADAEIHDCQPGSEQLTGNAAYIFGSANTERTVDMPAGVAFHLVPQQRIILEQHVINSGSDVIQGGVTFEISKPVEGTVIEHHAEVMWFANWSFAIPPNQESSATKHCTVPYAVNVFGLMSHTHKLGSHFSIEKWSASEKTHVYDNADWAHPLYQEHTPPIALAAGEGFEWTCTWNNTSSTFVGPGKNSTDEMCMTFGYAYPQEGLSGDPIQCN